METVRNKIMSLIQDIPVSYYNVTGNPVPMSREEILVRLFDIQCCIDDLIKNKI